MVRIALALSALLLGACSKGGDAPAGPLNESSPAAATAVNTFAGAGRDRLCLADGGRAAFITFGEGDANCSVRGQVEGSGERVTLVLEGDASCRIALNQAGDSVGLGPVGAACAYYCGPKASFGGKQFKRMEKNEPVVDLAGEALC